MKIGGSVTMDSNPEGSNQYTGATASGAGKKNAINAHLAATRAHESAKSAVKEYAGHRPYVKERAAASKALKLTEKARASGHYTDHSAAQWAHEAAAKNATNLETQMHHEAAAGYHTNAANAHFATIGKKK